jgi:hypothetical protein
MKNNFLFLHCYTGATSLTKSAGTEYLSYVGDSVPQEVYKLTGNSGASRQAAAPIHRGGLTHHMLQGHQLNIGYPDSEYGSRNSVADPDPGSGVFLTQDPGSGLSFFRIPDPKPIFRRA